jgi:hypothetical protein
MIFDRKATIDVPELLVTTGKRLGFEPVELLQAGLRIAQASLLKGLARTEVKQALSCRATGLLVVCGLVGSGYVAIAREIASMAVKDVTQMEDSPLLLDEMTTRAHIKAASVASHHCVVIATLLASDRTAVQARMTDILGQDIHDADLDLIGIVEVRSVDCPHSSDDGYVTTQTGIAVRFYPELRK